MDSLLVPSSIQRIRAFLVEMCGMKVKPWAGAEETLAALHATLVARQSCDVFWESLRTLMQTLARDLKTRQDAEPGTLLDNEVLSDERYASLLDEIRAALPKQATEQQPGAFRQLAHGLSAPALGLLLLLGGVTTVGCDGSSLRSTNKAPDAAVVDARLSQPDTAPATQPDSPPDNNIHIVIPDVAPQPDLRPYDLAYAATLGPDGAAVTLRDILDSCNIPSEAEGWILACLSRLHESWTTGTIALLAGKDCDTVARAFDRCSYASGCYPQSDEFDGNLPELCAPILIYLGVRFV
jgi:hypothetical protein